jgi:TPR repeat protein
MFAMSMRFLMVALAFGGVCTAVSAQDSSVMLNQRMASDPVSREGSGNYFLRIGEREFLQGAPRRAMEHWKQSAYWGHKVAQYNLGLMYFKGVGTNKNRVRGLAWLELSAERGDLPLQQAAAWARAQLSARDIAQAERLIREELAPRYADAVTLPRAMAQWRLDSRMTTGSHLGYVIGNLAVSSNRGTEEGMNRQNRLIEQGGPYAPILYPRVEVGDLRNLEGRP